MGLLSRIHNFLRGNKGIGSTTPAAPLQEEHELILEDTTPEEEKVQDAFNEDGLDTLVEEGVVENVISNED